MKNIFNSKSGKESGLVGLILIGVVIYMVIGMNSAGTIQSGAGTPPATTPPANTVTLVGAPCTQSTTLTSSIVRRYTEAAQTTQNITILQNGVLKGTIAHASTTTVQSGPNADLLDLYAGLESTTFYPRHLKGKLTTCTGSATTGDASFADQSSVDANSELGAPIAYSDATGIFSVSPNKLVQIDTTPTITIVNDGQANQNTGGQGQSTGFNLTIGAGGSGSVTVKFSPSSNVGFGVMGNALVCQFPQAVYDSANPLTVTVPGTGVLAESSLKPSSQTYPLIAANNTIKSYKFPGMDSRKTGDISFSIKATADANHNPAGANDRVNCTVADGSYYQKQNTGQYVIDIENRDTNVDLSGKHSVYDFEIGVA